MHVKTHQRKQQKTTQFDDLPDDLKIEIFCKLPYKYLMWCKCVSKHWLFVISKPNPCFPGWWTFMYCSPKKKRLESARKDSDSVFQSQRFSFDFLPCKNKKSIQVIHIINDLFLCFASHSAKLNRYYVCSPLTKQCMVLPPSSRGSSFYANLMYESGEQSKFKVVQVLREMSNHDNLMLQIFSSDAGEGIQYNVELNTRFCTDLIAEIVACNGFLYAITRKVDIGILVVNLNSLLNSSSQHRNHVIKLPKCRSFQEHAREPSVRACQGRLRAVRVAIRTVPVLYMWELKKDYSVEGDDKWNLLHCVSFTRMTTLRYNEWFFSNILLKRLPLEDGEYRFYEILDFHPVYESVVYLRIRGRVASYDMKSRVLAFHQEVNFPYHKRLHPVVFPWLTTPLPKG